MVSFPISCSNELLKYIQVSMYSVQVSALPSQGSASTWLVTTVALWSEGVLQ